MSFFDIFVRLYADRRSGPMVEFAIVGSVFFLFVGAILILSLDMFWQLTLDVTTRQAVRQIEIGKVTTGPEFVAAVCKGLNLVDGQDCAQNLQYSVLGANSFYASGGVLGTVTVGVQKGVGLANTGLFNLGQSSNSTTFILAQTALKVPFSFGGLIDSVAVQNGTNYLYSAVATALEPGA